jgi:hypothetical protein
MVSTIPGKPVSGNRYKKNGDIITRKIAGGVFLIPIRGRIADMERIFALNPVGECIWQEIEGQKCLDDIRNAVMARFDVEEEKADSDIREFLAELMEAELIRD